MSRLSVSVQYTIKDKVGPGYRGGSFNYAKNTAIPLYKMLSLVSDDIISHYREFTDEEEIIKQLKIFKEAVEKALEQK
jgi:hypothetical protein